MSTSLVLVIILAVVALLLLSLYFINRSVRSAQSQIESLRRSQTENQSFALMQQQIGQLTSQLNQQLQSMSSQFQRTTGDIGQSLGHVQTHLGKVEVATREVLDKARNISSLEDLLRAPKFRGGMGEFFLGDLLAQVFPPTSFTLQHRFKSGEKVDAVIRVGPSLVPVDAKFPLENFKKYIQEPEGKDKEQLRRKFIADVKKHIEDIAAKYILPDEGTYDFALMYIPAENIYYETIIKDETFGEERSVHAHALARRVIPVSPSSFYAYLQIIVFGIKGMEIEKSAREIYQRLTQLRGDLARFRGEFEVLGTHLTNARTRFEEAEKRLDKFSGRLELCAEEKPAELPEGPAPEGGGS